MSKVDMMLDALEAEAQQYEAYEENFSRFPRKRMPAQLRNRTNVSSVANQSPVSMRAIEGTPAHRAQFDIKIILNSAAASLSGEAVEFILFGASQLVTGYAEDFAGTRPTSVAFGGNGAYTNSDRVLITHAGTKGTVEIKCDTVNYPAFVQSLLVDRMVISRIRASINNTTAMGLETLSQQLVIENKSLFGKSTKNVISMGSYKVPEQNQIGIIDLPVNIPVTKDTLLRGKIVHVLDYAVAPAVQQILTLSVFVDFFQKA